MPDFSNIRNLIVVARDTYGGGIPATLLGLAENMCLYGYNGAIRVVTSNGGSTFKRLLGLPLSENTFSLNDTLCSNNPHALTFHTASETLPIADLALISPMDPLREYARINVGVHWNIGFKKSFRLYVRLFGMDHLEGSHYGHPQAWFSLPPIDPKILNAQRQRFRILAPIKADLIKQILQTPSTNAEIAIIYSQNILNIKHSILKHMQVIHERNPTKEMYLLTGMISPETWGFLQENFPQFNFTDSDQASSVNTVKNFLINPKNNSLVVRIPGTPSTIYRDLLPRITIANFEGSGSLSAFAHAAQQRTKESCFSPDRSMRTHIYKLPMNASLAKLARVAPIYRGNSRATGLVDYFKKKPLTPIEIREFAGLLDKCVETNTFGFYSNQTNATVIDDLSRAVAPGAIKYEPPFRTQGFTLGNAACIGLLGITNGILCNNFKYGLSMQLLLTYLLNISGVLSHEHDITLANYFTQEHYTLFPAGALLNNVVPILSVLYAFAIDHFENSIGHFTSHCLGAAFTIYQFTPMAKYLWDNPDQITDTLALLTLYFFFNLMMSSVGNKLFHAGSRFFKTVTASSDSDKKSHPEMKLI